VTVEVPVGLSGHAANLHVALNSAGKSIGAATVPVTFRTDANATAPAAGRFTAHAMPSWLIVAALVGIGGALLVGTFAVLFLAIGRSRMRARLRQLDHFGADRTSQSATQAAEGSIFVRAALALSERAVQRRDQQTTIEAALDRAGIELRPAEWLLLRVIGAAVAGGLLALLLPWYVGLVVGTLLGWAASGAYRHLRTARRARKFGDLLPDALQLLVGALRSGFSLTQGIDALVREGPEPVASEFGRALAETRLGGEMEEALERTAARNSSRDLAWLVMAIRIQREVGGNLSEVLETAVETMRERARLRRHVRGLSAEGRLSAYVLVGMPIALALWMFVVRRSYLRPLYTEPLGIAMLVAAAVMLGIGSFWMSRLVKVEV
jgi:tight adherence protein B